MEKKYVNLSLDDKRTGRIAEVLSNKTCRKILDLLMEKELSESGIAKELNSPINTVDYNVKKLIKSGLIEEKSFFWSKKKKRVSVYKVANKKIIISPKRLVSDKIRKVLPAFLISFIFTVFVYLNNFYFKSKSVESLARVMDSGGLEKGVGFLGLGLVEWFLIFVWTGIILFTIISIKSEGGK